MIHKSVRVFGVLSLLFCIFLIFSTVSAQTPLDPQKVIAEYVGEIPAGVWNPDCPAIPVHYVLEVWNVGAEGGADYATGKFIVKKSGHCNVVDGAASLVVTGDETRMGTFSGGPDGVFTFDDPESASVLVQFHNRTADLIYPGEMGNYYNATLTVTNPEAFTDVTATPAGACSPVIFVPPGLKPGDTLSPEVSFTDTDGKPIAPLSSVLYINGAQTYSTVWDGRQTSVLLQYTCPDHSAGEKSISVPAYTGDAEQSAPIPPAGGQPAGPPPADDQPGDTAPPASPPDGAPIADDGGGLMKTIAVAGGIVTGVVGAIGAAISGGMTLAQAVKPAASAASAASGPAPQTKIAEKAPEPVRVEPPSPPQQPPPQSVRAEPPAQPQQPAPQPQKPLTPEQRYQLQGRRQAMLNQIDQDRSDYYRMDFKMDRLKAIHKQNLYKYIIKNSYEIISSSTTDPKDLLIGELMDPVMEKIFGMEDGELTDEQILVKMHQAINEYQSEMADRRKDAVYLRNEIYKIEQQLAGK